MPKKIGIVSLYIGQNFGNKLQNYAVEQIIASYGFAPVTFRYEVEQAKPVVQVSMREKLKFSYMIRFLKVRLSHYLPLKNSDCLFIRKLPWLFRQNEMRGAKRRQLEAYRYFDQVHLHFADHTIALEEYDYPWTDEYAYFFCGSDQVWNPYYQTTNRNCFLQFAPKEKRIAFAPSFGVSEIPKERVPDFRKWIGEISYLSVREETGKRIIEELTGRDVVVLVDPTMMLTVRQWDGFAKEPSFHLPERYILTYFLGDRTKEYGTVIDEYAEHKECAVIHLLDLMAPEYYGCDPNEFVYCVKKAELICTDSFHATVFSILYHKDFIVFDRIEGNRKMNSRIQTLLDTFSLQDRLFSTNARNKGYYDAISMDIWEDVDRKIEESRVESSTYITKIWGTRMKR